MKSTKTSEKPSTTGSTSPKDQPAFLRANPKMDGKIDNYIWKNPMYWAYVQNMPRERLERAIVLTEVRALELQKRMRKLEKIVVDIIS